MSVTAQEIKRISRDNLNNKYRLVMGAFILANLVTAVIELPFSKFLSDNPTITQTIIYYVVEFLIALVSIVMTVGQYSIHLDIARQKRELPSQLRIFHYFKNQPDRYILAGILLLVLTVISVLPLLAVSFLAESMPDIIYIVLVAVAGIVSLVLFVVIQLHFALLYFVLLEHSEMGLGDAIRVSLGLMKGHKVRLFQLYISFVGFDLLAVLSLGIGFVWVVPYQMQVTTNFYLDVIGELPEHPYMNHYV